MDVVGFPFRYGSTKKQISILDPNFAITVTLKNPRTWLARVRTRESRKYRKLTHSKLGGERKHPVGIPASCTASYKGKSY